jgi:enamine deaminase RidA (YjgF/YER057c/UK114 family)
VPQAVESGGWIYVSALFGADPQTGRIPEEGRAEAEKLFANLEAILQAADTRLTDVVRVGIFMKQLQRDRRSSMRSGGRCSGTTGPRGRRYRPVTSAGPGRRCGT